MRSEVEVAVGPVIPQIATPEHFTTSGHMHASRWGEQMRIGGSKARIGGSNEAAGLGETPWPLGSAARLPPSMVPHLLTTSRMRHKKIV